MNNALLAKTPLNLVTRLDNFVTMVLTCKYEQYLETSNRRNQNESYVWKGLKNRAPSISLGICRLIR